MEINDYPYWMTLAHLPNWRTERKNNLINNIIDKRVPMARFFSSDISTLRPEFGLSAKEAQDILQAKDNLTTNLVLAQQLLSQGVKLLPLRCSEYPAILKRNLSLKHSPPLLYVKGNTELLSKSKVAIVGSRRASNRGIKFAKLMAKRCASEDKVVVSGYAKGVDRIALETALESNGNSIVVLPQGVLTFSSGFKRLHKYILEGQILVVSTYLPQAGWSVGLAMERNVYLYALAEEIYVAEAESKGGTWYGAIDGLKKGRKILIRQAAPEEKCANNELIAKGAIAVDELANMVANRVIQGWLFIPG